MHKCECDKHTKHLKQMKQHILNMLFFNRLFQNCRCDTKAKKSHHRCPEHHEYMDKKANNNISTLKEITIIFKAYLVTQ